jgi:hypothetical protein
MAGTVAPFPYHQFLTTAGAPAASHKLFTYASGTSTKLATYSDADLTSANANPIVLDSAGRAKIFLQAATYKFVLAPSTDADPPTSPIWTIDGVAATPSFNVNLDITGTAGEALSANDFVYLSDGSGGLTAGRWYKTDADNTYSSTTAGRVGVAVAAISSAATGSIRVAGQITGLAGLSAGSAYFISATAGAITASAPTNKRGVGSADSTTTVILGPIQGANETVGPLPAISGTNLTGVDKYLSSVIATVGNVGVGEDILATYSLAAAKLATNGEAVRAVFWGLSANNANAKTLRIRVIEGANNTVLIAFTLTVSQAGHWLLGALITRTAATTFRAGSQGVVGPTNAQTTAAYGNVTSSSTATWANAVEIRLTGEATSDNDVTVEGGSIVLVSV